MPGTKAGWQNAKATMIAKWGEDKYRKHWAEIGRKGGRNGHTGGFAYGDNAKKFGARGGKRSRRGFKLVAVIDGVGMYRNMKTGEVEEVKINE